MSYKQELDERVKGSERHGKLNNRLARALLAIGFLASAFASISVLTRTLTPEINGIGRCPSCNRCGGPQDF